MFQILTEDLQAGGLTTFDAQERAYELLQPVEKVRAAHNRRTFAHLLEAASRAKAAGLGIRKKDES